MLMVAVAMGSTKMAPDEDLSVTTNSELGQQPSSLEAPLIESTLLFSDGQSSFNWDTVADAFPAAEKFKEKFLQTLEEAGHAQKKEVSSDYISKSVESDVEIKKFAVAEVSSSISIKDKDGAVVGWPATTYDKLDDFVEARAKAIAELAGNGVIEKTSDPKETAYAIKDGISIDELNKQISEFFQLENSTSLGSSNSAIQEKITAAAISSQSNEGTSQSEDPNKTKNAPPPPPNDENNNDSLNNNVNNDSAQPPVNANQPPDVIPEPPTYAKQLSNTAGVGNEVLASLGSMKDNGKGASKSFTMTGNLDVQEAFMKLATQRNLVVYRGGQPELTISSKKAMKLYHEAANMVAEQTGKPISSLELAQVEIPRDNTGMFSAVKSFFKPNHTATIVAAGTPAELNTAISKTTAALNALDKAGAFEDSQEKTSVDRFSSQFKEEVKGNVPPPEPVVEQPTNKKNKKNAAADAAATAPPTEKVSVVPKVEAAPAKEVKLNTGEDIIGSGKPIKVSVRDTGGGMAAFTSKIKGIVSESAQPSQYADKVRNQLADIKSNDDVNYKKLYEALASVKELPSALNADVGRFDTRNDFLIKAASLIVRANEDRDLTKENPAVIEAAANRLQGWAKEANMEPAEVAARVQNLVKAGVINESMAQSVQGLATNANYQLEPMRELKKAPEEKANAIKSGIAQVEKACKDDKIKPKELKAMANGLITKMNEVASKYNLHAVGKYCAGIKDMVLKSVNRKVAGLSPNATVNKVPDFSQQAVNTAAPSAGKAATTASTTSTPANTATAKNAEASNEKVDAFIRQVAQAKSELQNLTHDKMAGIQNTYVNLNNDAGNDSRLTSALVGYKKAAEQAFEQYAETKGMAPGNVPTAEAKQISDAYKNGTVFHSTGNTEIVKAIEKHHGMNASSKASTEASSQPNSLSKTENGGFGPRTASDHTSNLERGDRADPASFREAFKAEFNKSIQNATAEKAINEAKANITGGNSTKPVKVGKQEIPSNKVIDMAAKQADSGRGR